MCSPATYRSTSSDAGSTCSLRTRTTSPNRTFVHPVRSNSGSVAQSGLTHSVFRLAAEIGMGHASRWNTRSVLCSSSPRRGRNKSAQGRAESAAGGRSAALGWDASHRKSPVRATQRRFYRRHLFRPYRAGKFFGHLTQGGGHARITRVALPWADLLRPFGARISGWALWPLCGPLMTPLAPSVSGLPSIVDEAFESILSHYAMSYPSLP